MPSGLMYNAKFVKSCSNRGILRNTLSYVGPPKTIVTGHHQSNGLAERAIQELKFALRKTLGEDAGAIQCAIASFCLSFNSSPACNGSVPSSMTFLKAPSLAPKGWHRVPHFPV